MAKNRVRIAFSVAKYSTPYGERTGVATGWLKRCIETKQRSETEAMPVSFPVRIRSGGAFRLPSALDRPLVLIGPGTGIAPFLGFLAERKLCTQVNLTSYEQTPTNGDLGVGRSCRSLLALFRLSSRR